MLLYNTQPFQLYQVYLNFVISGYITSMSHKCWFVINVSVCCSCANPVTESEHHEISIEFLPLSYRLTSLFHTGKQQTSSKTHSNTSDKYHISDKDSVLPIQPYLLVIHCFSLVIDRSWIASLLHRFFQSLLKMKVTGGSRRSHWRGPTAKSDKKTDQISESGRSGGMPPGKFFLIVQNANWANFSFFVRPLGGGMAPLPPPFPLIEVLRN